MSLFLVFICSLFVTAGLIPLLIRLAPRLGLVDPPSDRKVHREIMPRLGGIAMAVGALVPLFSLLGGEPPVLTYLLAALLLILMGVWDDRAELGYKTKFLCQLAAAWLVFRYGDVEITRLSPLWNTDLPELLRCGITLVFLLAATNAINLSDGLDGLAGGMCLLALGTSALMAWESGRADILVILLALIGATAGFLRYNSYPARLFMGDAGSQFIGFSLGVLVLWLTQRPDSAYSGVVPLFLLGLPLVDTVIVMGRRILDGCSPFRADRGHLHHRLLDAGLDHYEVVMLMYFAQALLVVSAFMLRYQSDGVLLALYLLIALATALGVSRAVARAKTRSGLAKQVTEMRTAGAEFLVGRVARGVLAVLLSLFLVAAAWAMGSRGGDIFGVVLLGILLLVPYRGGAWGLVSARLGVYLCGAICVYLIQVSMPDLPWIDRTFSSAMLGIAVALIVALRFTPQADFELSPLDFLVIFTLLSLPVVAESLKIDPLFSHGVAGIVVIFYASEFILSTPRGRGLLIRSCLVSLLLTVTGILS